MTCRCASIVRRIDGPNNGVRFCLKIPVSFHFFLSSMNWILKYTTVNSLNTNILFAVCFSGVLFGCRPESRSIDDQFKHYLNISASSIGIDLVGTASDHAPVLFSKGHFTYKADGKTVESLLQHSEFKEKHAANQTIEPVNCNSSGFPTDFTYWTDAPVSIKNKECYEGIFFPYIHYLIHDPSERTMHHFVSGMRD